MDTGLRHACPTVGALGWVATAAERPAGRPPRPGETDCEVAATPGAPGALRPTLTTGVFVVESSK